MFAKEVFETVVFEEKTTEKFQIECHLNNTPLSKVISYKIYFNIKFKVASGQHPLLSFTEKFILLGNCV